MDLPSLLQWIDKLPVEYGDNLLRSISCIEPDFLNIGILPNNIKKTALLKFEQTEFLNKRRHMYFLEQIIYPIKNALKSEEKAGIEKDLKNFYKYTSLLDQHRGNNFEKTFPELNALLDEDKRWKM